MYLKINEINKGQINKADNEMTHIKQIIQEL